MIGVIADDLTGAAELGALGRRWGLSAEIIFGPQSPGPSDVVCLDTDSRSCRPPEARRRAAAAAACLRQAGADWIYKKVDSLLRGNVTVEVEAVRKQLGCPSALLVPANPSLGRVIRAGRYFVRGRPLHLTEFRHDPHHPRRTSGVRRLLAVRGGPAIHVAPVGHPLPPEGIVVGEAATAADLRRWAALQSPDRLCAGGAEFFGALLQRTVPRAHARGPDRDFPPEAAGPQLFVCGSLSDATQDFIVRELLEGTRIFSLPHEVAHDGRFPRAAARALGDRAAAALQTRGRVILQVGLPRVGNPRVARALSAHLVRLAQFVLRRVKVRLMFAEGGATAALLVRQMKWHRLLVRRELALGVAVLEVAQEPSKFLTIKPGSYKWPGVIRRLGRVESRGRAVPTPEGVLL